MRRDSKLSSVLHTLLHMAHSDRPLTSEELAGCLRTNPVVVRRVLGNLRDLGYVDAVKGHRGGWSIACDLSQITLRDLYEAIGAPSIFALGNRMENPGCLVEQAVNAALGSAFDDAEALLLSRFGAVTLAHLSADFHERMAARGQSHDLEKVHDE